MTNCPECNSTELLDLDGYYACLDCESGVYEILNTQNNKRYIGSTVNFIKRRREHYGLLRQKRHFNIKLQNAWDKYGEDIFEFNVIECVADVEKLVEREQFYMDLYDVASRDKGYNLRPTANNFLGYTHSDETKQKISVSRIGSKNPMWGKTGVEHPKFGSVLSHEHREAVSAANKKRIISKETRKKLSDSHKGKQHSVHTRIRISERIKAYRRQLREQYNQEVDKIQLLLWEE